MPGRVQCSETSAALLRVQVQRRSHFEDGLGWQWGV